MRNKSVLVRDNSDLNNDLAKFQENDLNIQRKNLVVSPKGE